MISFDLDQTHDGYFFSYAPDAAASAAQVDPNEGQSEGTSWGVFGASAALIASLVGILAFFVSRMDASRRHEGPEL